MVDSWGWRLMPSYHLRVTPRAVPRIHAHIFSEDSHRIRGSGPSIFVGSLLRFVRGRWRGWPPCRAFAPKKWCLSRSLWSSTGEHREFYVRVSSLIGPKHVSIAAQPSADDVPRLDKYMLAADIPFEGLIRDLALFAGLKMHISPVVVTRVFRDAIVPNAPNRTWLRTPRSQTVFRRGKVMVLYGCGSRLRSSRARVSEPRRPQRPRRGFVERVSYTVALSDPLILHTP